MGNPKQRARKSRSRARGGGTRRSSSGCERKATERCPTRPPQEGDRIVGRVQTKRLVPGVSPVLAPLPSEQAPRGAGRGGGTGLQKLLACNSRGGPSSKVTSGGLRQPVAAMRARISSKSDALESPDLKNRIGPGPIRMRRGREMQEGGVREEGRKRRPLMLGGLACPLGRLVFHRRLSTQFCLTTSWRG